VTRERACPRIPDRASVARLAAGALIALVATAAGCHDHAVRTAPFPTRPDSVAPGNLRGPFDGRVVDAENGNPVAGALVYATWRFESGYGLAQPAGFREFVASTDATGRYTIPALESRPPGDSARLTDFQLIIYKRGYVAYRSDRRFRDFGPRMDFAQHYNEVELERWRSDYSHARHLRYVGGGSALAALTAWEAEEAAAELSGEGGPTRVASDLLPRRAAGSEIVAGQLLVARDIQGTTGFDGAFETGPLGDEPDTDQYSSQHFKALGQPESFDVAVRVWNVNPSDAETRYESLATTLPNAEERDEVADRSLRAVEGDIYGVAYLDRARGLVVLVTCGHSQCSSVEQVATLADRTYANVRSLWSNPGTAVPDLDEPEPAGPPAPTQPLQPQPRTQPTQPQPPRAQPQTQPTQPQTQPTQPPGTQPQPAPTQPSPQEDAP
jgi:hypothetical protein